MAEKRGDQLEVQRLTELVEAGRAAVAVLDGATGDGNAKPPTPP